MCIATIRHQGVNLLDEEAVGQLAVGVDLRDEEEEIDLLLEGHLLEGAENNGIITIHPAIGWVQENL